MKLPTEEQLTLQAERFIEARLVQLRELSQDLDVQALVTRELHGMLIRLVATVYCEHERTEDHHYPTTWWDAFKVRWFPAWVLRRWPAQWTTVRLIRKRLYPDVQRPIGRAYQYQELRISTEDGAP